VIKLRGRRAGKPFVREIRVNLPAAEPRHDVLATLWARNRIDSLMSKDWAGAQNGSIEKIGKIPFALIAAAARGVTLRLDGSSVVCGYWRTFGCGIGRATAVVPLDVTRTLPQPECRRILTQQVLHQRIQTLHCGKSRVSRLWFQNGRPLEAGGRVVQKDLADTLRGIAGDGSAAFYKGAVARATVDFMKANGGQFAENDLAKFSAHEDQPIQINYRGIDVYECPPNSQAHVMLQALNILEGFNLRYMGHNSVPYLHVVTEALKLAFADRNRYVGDPRFVPPIPMKGCCRKNTPQRGVP